MNILKQIYVDTKNSTRELSSKSPEIILNHPVRSLICVDYVTEE